METSDSACPTCDVPSRLLDATAGAPFQRYGCQTCELEFWSPRRMDPSFYESGGHHTYERRHHGEHFVRDRHLEFLEIARPGKLLDVGCGEGSFLEIASARGFSVTGIDLDAVSIQIARSRGLSSTYHTMLLDAAGDVVDMVAAAGAFDWITAFEVLEHQARPLSFLRATRSLLAPGGTLCGSVPNRNRAFADRDRERNRGDFPPHHFLWFSQSSLQRMLSTAGFREIKIYPLVERDPFAFASYLENALLGGLTRNLKRRTKERMASAPTSPRVKGGMVSVARRIKNLPFVPFAHAIKRFAPARSRALFFRARS